MLDKIFYSQVNPLIELLSANVAITSTGAVSEH